MKKLLTFNEVIKEELRNRRICTEARKDFKEMENIIRFEIIPNLRFEQTRESVCNFHMAKVNKNRRFIGIGK